MCGSQGTCNCYDCRGKAKFWPHKLNMDRIFRTRHVHQGAHERQVWQVCLYVAMRVFEQRSGSGGVSGGERQPPPTAQVTGHTAARAVLWRVAHAHTRRHNRRMQTLRSARRRRGSQELTAEKAKEKEVKRRALANCPQPLHPRCRGQRAPMPQRASGDIAPAADNRPGPRGGC